MLVPYETERARHAVRKAFEDYQRFGARGAATGDPPRDLERGAPLWKNASNNEEKEIMKLVRASKRQSNVTLCALLLAVSLVIAVFVGAGVALNNANTSLTAMRHLIQPHAAQVVNSTLGMLDDMSGSMSNIKSITDMTSSLAQTDFGPDGAAGKALNSTAAIAERLAVFMTHPQITLSLGDNTR
jgi:hypothetical protein